MSLNFAVQPGPRRGPAFSRGVTGQQADTRLNWDLAGDCEGAALSEMSVARAWLGLLSSSKREKESYGRFLSRSVCRLIWLPIRSGSTREQGSSSEFLASRAAGQRKMLRCSR